MARRTDHCTLHCSLSLKNNVERWNQITRRTDYLTLHGSLSQKLNYEKKSIHCTDSNIINSLPSDKIITIPCHKSLKITINKSYHWTSSRSLQMKHESESFSLHGSLIPKTSRSLLSKTKKNETTFRSCSWKWDTLLARAPNIPKLSYYVTTPTNTGSDPSDPTQHVHSQPFVAS